MPDRWEALLRDSLSGCWYCNISQARCDGDRAEGRKCCPDCDHDGTTTVATPALADLLAERDALRREWDAWMNGVADAVERYGYNREAACGPADLLPGLRDLVAERDALAELVRQVTNPFDDHDSGTYAWEGAVWWTVCDCTVTPDQAELIERINRENP